MKSSKRIFSGGGYNRRKTFPRLHLDIGVPALSPLQGNSYPGTSKEARQPEVILPGQTFVSASRCS